MLDNFLNKFPYIIYKIFSLLLWLLVLLSLHSFNSVLSLYTYVNLTICLALKKKVLLNIQPLTKQQVTIVKIPYHWLLLHYRTKSLKSKIWHNTISSLSL